MESKILITFWQKNWLIWCWFFSPACWFLTTWSRFWSWNCGENQNIQIHSEWQDCLVELSEFFSFFQAFWSSQVMAKKAAKSAMWLIQIRGVKFRLGWQTKSHLMLLQECSVNFIKPASSTHSGNHSIGQISNTG